MLKNLTLSAILVSLLCPALSAGILEDAYGAASVAARKAEADPCSDNKEFEKMVFRFKLEGDKGSDSLDVRFSFVQCVVTDEIYDHHGATPRALRSYKGDVGGYVLFLQTVQGSVDSAVSLVQDELSSSLTPLGAKSNAALLTQRIDFAAVSVPDSRAANKKVTGSAILLSYDPTPKPADPNGPKGCQ